MKVYAWLIDFAHFRENCPTGVIPEWMQKVTRHNGIIQWMRFSKLNSVESSIEQYLKTHVLSIYSILNRSISSIKWFCLLFSLSIHYFIFSKSIAFIHSTDCTFGKNSGLCWARKFYPFLAVRVHNVHAGTGIPNGTNAQQIPRQEAVFRPNDKVGEESGCRLHGPWKKIPVIKYFPWKGSVSPTEFR